MRRSSSVFHNNNTSFISALPLALVAALVLQALPCVRGGHPERNWVAEFKRFGVGKADWPEYPYQKTTDEGQKWVRRSLRVKPAILQAQASSKRAWQEGVKYNSMLHTVDKGARSVERMATETQMRIADENDAVFQHYVGKATHEVEGHEHTDRENDNVEEAQGEADEAA